MPLSNWKIEARTSAYVTALIAVPVLALGAWCMKVFGGSPEPALFYLGMLVCLPFVALGLLVPDLFTSSLYIPLSFFLSGLWLFLLVLGFRLLVAPLARRWRLARVAARFIGLAAGLAALSSLGWFAWWTDVPVSLRELKPVGGCTADAPGGAETFSPDKLGTFQVKWQGDNTALIETWVGHTILRLPDRASFRARRHGSALRLSYSTTAVEMPPGVPPLACFGYYRILVEANGLPRHDYDVASGNWF